MTSKITIFRNIKETDAPFHREVEHIIERIKNGASKELVKCDEAVAFMKSHQKNGWLNLNIKYAQSGKPYVELDTWQPTKKTEAVNEPVAQASDDLPF